MAYRNPRFYLYHMMRNVNASGTILGSAFHATNVRGYLHDSGRSKLGQFLTSQANNFVSMDRTASWATLPIPDHLIIPSGHTMISTTTLELRTNALDPVNGTTGTVIYSQLQAAGARLLPITVGANNNRWWSFTVPTFGSWAFPEFWLTQQRTTVRGPAPSWSDSKVSNLFEAQMRSGETYRLELGAERRFFEFQYHGLSGADLLVFTDMRTETRNGLFPIYVDPPDDTESPILMQILDGMEFEQDHPAPNAGQGQQYRLKLKLLEVLA